MTLKKILVAILAVGCLTANAATYLVSPSATSAGATISYKGQNYVVGTTAFADIAALVAANPSANSKVYVAPGTYGGATISVAGLNFEGANAFIDGRAQTRGSASTITGSIVVNANNVTLNGFNFSGAGKVYNTAATNTAPLSGFTFIYNVLNNSTIARTSSGSGSTGFLRLGKVYTDANANAENTGGEAAAENAAAAQQAQQPAQQSYAQLEDIMDLDVPLASFDDIVGSTGSSGSSGSSEPSIESGSPAVIEENTKPRGMTKGLLIFFVVLFFCLIDLLYWYLLFYRKKKKYADVEVVTFADDDEEEDDFDIEEFRRRHRKKDE